MGGCVFSRLIIMELEKRFISATREYSSYEKSINAPYMRRSFVLSAKAVKAELKIAGLGFYELWINGEKITKGLLSPYLSNPDHFIYYDVYDLAPYLTAGENVIGVLLGEGFLNDYAGVPYQYDRADFRSASKLACAFECTTEDGKTLTFEADGQFKVHPSPIIMNGLRVGERYDANLEVDGWNLPGFDDSAWENAIRSEPPRGFLTEHTLDPIIKEYELTPVHIYKGKIGEMPHLWDRLKDVHVPEDMNREGYIYDFGSNHAGIFRLRVKGKKGQKIVMQFGELLDKNGNLDLGPMSAAPYGYSQRAEYTCKGDGIEEYTPSFTFFGYQYCLVMGITEEQAKPELLTYLVMHSKLDKSGEFRCSDEVVNRIEAATINADKSNFFHIPTDCPTREKNCWLGDTCYSLEQLLMNFHCEPYIKEWLKMIYFSQSDEGEFHACVPAGTDWSYGQGPSTDSSSVLMPYMMWKYTGDKTYLRDAATSVLRYLNYITTKVGEDWLMHSGLGDFCHVAREADKFKAPRIFTNTMIFIRTAKCAMAIYDILGWKAHKHFAEDIYNELRKAARLRLVDFGTMTVIGDCQTAQAMGIAYGLFDPAEEKLAFDVLVRMIEENGGFMDVGTLGAVALFDVLADHGRADLAYKMITRKEFPSYGWLVEQGGSSLWEDFRMGETTNGSKNHHFWGHVSAWFKKYLAGIRINPCGVSASDINIQPNFLQSLDFASGCYDSVVGKVSVDWKRDGDEIVLTLSYPQGANGFIILPHGWQFEDGKCMRDAASGEYRLLPTSKPDRLTDKGAFGR